MYDSFTDYEQLNSLNLKRIADAAELKVRTKKGMQQQINNLREEKYILQGNYTEMQNRLLASIKYLQRCNAALRGTITKMKKNTP